MDLFKLFFNRLPVGIARDSRPNVKVDPRDKQMPLRSNQSREVAQAALRLERIHVAQEVVSYHYVLGSY